jgi:hypothetical protein
MTKDKNDRESLEKYKKDLESKLEDMYNLREKLFLP